MQGDKLRFLITGASGFIGYALTTALKNRYGIDNIQIIIPGFDVHEKESVRRQKLIREGYDYIEHDILNEELEVSGIRPFDVLFHLAAFTATEKKSKMVHTNDMGTRRLLDSLGSRLKGKRIIYTGSLASVDRNFPDNKLQDEEYPCHPRTPYGKTKLAGEKIIQSYANKFNFEWIIFRLVTVYGSGYRPEGMFSIIKDGLLSNKLATQITWPGRVGLVYIEDVINILLMFIDTLRGANTVYHLTSKDNPEFDQLINIIADILSIKRNRISPPAWFWSMLRFFIWLPGIYAILPYKLKIILWRISLIISDGIVADGGKLDQITKYKYKDLKEGLTLTYKIADLIQKPNCSEIEDLNIQGKK